MFEYHCSSTVVGEYGVEDRFGARVATWGRNDVIE